MNETLKIFLLFQSVWIVLLLVVLGGAALTGTHESYRPPEMYVDNPAMTTMQAPGMGYNDLEAGLELVAFLAVAGLPFEAMLLWHHRQDQGAALGTTPLTGQGQNL